MPTINTREHLSVNDTSQNRGLVDFAAVANRVRNEVLLRYRRFVFDDFFRNIRLTPYGIYVARENGVSNILTALYNFVYQYSFFLDSSRSVRPDDISLRYCTLQILNDCACDDYISLFEMIHS